MKYIGLIIMFFSTSFVLAQEKLVESGVYKWNEKTVGMKNSFTKNLMVHGKTSDLEGFEVYAVSLLNGKNSVQKLSSDTSEVILIVKEGTLDVGLGNMHKSLTKGGVVYVLPGETYTVTNTGNKPTSCFLISMNARKPADLKRGKDAGGSFMIDMEEQEFKPHDKGGSRNYFRDRPTAMFGFTEMHVTTLKPKIKSHEPHTHHAAEMILMLSGQTEMQIGDGIYQATGGDFYFIDSEVSHAIRNTGDTPCVYVAFQWE